MSNDDIIDILNKLNETISENNIILKRIEEKWISRLHLNVK